MSIIFILVPNEMRCLFKYCKKSTELSFTPTQVIVFPTSISDNNCLLIFGSSPFAFGMGSPCGSKLGKFKK